MTAVAANLHLRLSATLRAQTRDSCGSSPAERFFGNQTVMLMSKRFQYSMAIVSCALLTCACSSNRTGERGAASSTGRQQAVKLSGCVEMTGMDNYILQRLHIEGNDTDAAPRTTVNPAPTGIIEGSWVRLTGARDLPSLAGRRVVVIGVVVDTGRNTIGTGGVSSGVVVPSGDVSQASTSDRYWVKVKKEAGPIARESIASGTAAEVKVTEITDLGEGCHGPTGT